MKFSEAALHPHQPSMPGGVVCAARVNAFESGVCGYPPAHSIHAVGLGDRPRVLDVDPGAQTPQEPDTAAPLFRMLLDLFEMRVRTVTRRDVTGQHVPEALRAGIDSTREDLIKLHAEGRRP